MTIASIIFFVVQALVVVVVMSVVLSLHGKERTKALIAERGYTNEHIERHGDKVG